MDTVDEVNPPRPLASGRVDEAMSCLQPYNLRSRRGGEPSPSPPCRPRPGGLLADRSASIPPGDPPRTNKTAPWTHKIAPWTHKTAPWTHTTGSRAQNCSLDIQLMRKIIAKYVQIPFFHKKSKIHRFLINFVFLLTKFQNLALMRNLGLEEKKS